MNLTKYFFIFLLSFSVYTIAAAQTKILVFSKTAGFRHESIEDGIKAIKKLGAENKFDVVATEDASAFNESNLKHSVRLFFSAPQGIYSMLHSRQKWNVIFRQEVVL